MPFTAKDAKMLTESSNEKRLVAEKERAEWQVPLLAKLYCRHIEKLIIRQARRCKNSLSVHLSDDATIRISFITTFFKTSYDSDTAIRGQVASYFRGLGYRTSESTWSGTFEVKW